MPMKSSAFLFFLLFSFSFLTMNGQTIERKVINTTGTSYNISSIRIKNSIGEPIIGKVGSLQEYIYHKVSSPEKV